MDPKRRRQMQLECLYEMFRDRIEEDVIYFVYTENEGNIHATIDQLMSIASCAFTGHQFTGPASSVEVVNTFIGAGGAVHTTTGSQTRRKLVGKCGARANDADDKVAEENNLQVSYEDEVTEETEEEEDCAELSIDERIQCLQRSIDDLLAEKDLSHGKACHYLTRKMYPVTTYYSELASQMRRMIQAKTDKLVDLLLEKCKNSDNIDLHGLNPVQARLVISELIKVRQSKLLVDKQGEVSIDIITGWGKHSVNQGHRIRPTIVALLKEKGFKYHHLNKGALRVTIKKETAR